MKTIKLYSILVVVLLTSIITSCVEDSDFEVPEVVVNPIEPDLTDLQEVTFSAVKSAYEQEFTNNGESTFTFEDDLYITGYVASSDAAGNFFEELVIQNSIDGEDLETGPRLGIQLEINVSSLSQTYEIGRKVYVKLNGLSVGLSGDEAGVLVLGKANEGTIGQIESFEYTSFILRSTEVVTLEPKIISLEDINENDMNTLIQIPVAQFNKDELGLTFAGEPTDSFNGERTIESCADNGSIIFETSTFSDFKSLSLPLKSGNLTAILTKDFFGEINILKINSFSDISFEGERCDPIFDCGLATTEGATILFEDNFDSLATNSLVSGNGWTNYMEAGSEAFETFRATSQSVSYEETVSIRIGAFGSGDVSNIAWLITPEIDLDANTNATFSFDTSTSFSDNSELQILMSANWDGTEEGITSANWETVPRATVVSNEQNFADWVNSEIVDLSCVTGKVHIAFKYIGTGDVDSDGTYEIDNISVKAE